MDIGSVMVVTLFGGFLCVVIGFLIACLMDDLDLDMGDSE